MPEKFSGAMDEDPEVAFGNAGGFQDFIGGGTVDFAGEEDFGGSIGEAFDALGEDGLELGARGGGDGVAAPIGGSVVGIDVAHGIEEVGGIFAGSGEVGFGDLAFIFSPVFAEFVFEDAGEPGSFGGAPFEAVACFEGGEEGVLDEVFGDGAIADAEHGISEEVVAILIDPLGGIEGGWRRVVHWMGSGRARE